MAKTKTQQLKKIIDDAELREHAISALQSVHQAVEEARGTEQQISRRAEKKLKKAQNKAHKTAEAKEMVMSKLAEKTEAAQASAEKAAKAAEKSKKKRHPVRKLLVVATLGAVVALVVSEDARKAVLDALFGAEEEFEYTSTTAAASSNGAS